MTVPVWRENAYQAVHQSGLLTEDAYANARIWRAVECALNDVEPVLTQAWDEGFAAVDMNAWVNWAAEVPTNPYSTQ